MMSTMVLFVHNKYNILWDFFLNDALYAVFWLCFLLVTCFSLLLLSLMSELFATDFF